MAETYSIDHVVEELEDFIAGFPTIKAAAEELGVNRVFLWKVLNKERPPSERILAKLGYEAERKIIYEYHKV